MLFPFAHEVPNQHQFQQKDHAGLAFLLKLRDELEDIGRAGKKMKAESALKFKI